MTQNFDNQTYNIGHTEPPKNRSGLIAMLLIVIIFLGGVISILGLLNISLFQQLLKKNRNKDALAVAVREEQEDVSALEVTYGDETLVIEHSPQSMEHFPLEGGMSVQDIYAGLIRSLVSVETGSQNGTGVILTADGYILTNNHVITDAKKINIQLTDGEKLPATVVGRDSFSDLAILKVEAEDFVPATFGDSTVLREGDVVIAIGSFNGTGVLAEGIVSSISRDIPAGGGVINLLQTSTSLDRAQSGSVIINCYGQIVGIHTHCAANIMTLNGTEADSFSLESVTVKDIADQLINHGVVEGRVHLGIHGQEIDEFYQHYYDIPRGIFITAIEEGSELYARGVREGDILINLAGKPILSFDILNSLVTELQQGQEVTAVIYRDGTQYQLKVTIGEKP